MGLLQQLLNSPHTSSVLVVIGAILTVIGFYQVVRKGFALFFWLFLFAIGIVPLVYVYKGSDLDFISGNLVEAGSQIPEIKDDLLKVWCDKFDNNS